MHQPTPPADSVPSVASSSAPQTPQIIVVQQGGRAWQWVVAFALGLLAAGVFFRWDESLLVRRAFAQAGANSFTPQLGGRGIYAFTGQLTSRTWGLFMMDVDSGTVWCYEMDRGPNNEPRMKLVAARSWIFDRYLEEFNVADPIPAAVRMMVQQQRSQRELAPGPAAPATAPAGPELKLLPEGPR